MNIAVFRFSALGDCVLVLSAIRALQTQLPKAKVTWIIEKNLLPLFDNIEDIKFLAIKKPRSLRDYANLKRQLADYEFDILLAMQASLRSNLIYPLIKAKRKIGFDKHRGRELHTWFIDESIDFKEEHLLDSFMSFVDKLSDSHQSDSSSRKLSWKFDLAAHDLAWAKAQLQGLKMPVIAINPAASKLERCCSAGFYADLILQASEKMQCSFVLTGGPTGWEVALSKNIVKLIAQKQLSLNVLNLVGKTSLPQLAALIAQIDVFIAPDTGPIHLADALGARVVGLYAVAPPALTGPYQNQALVINKYPEALAKLVKPRTRHSSWAQRVHHPKAMSFFKVQEVLLKLSMALSEKS